MKAWDFALVFYEREGVKDAALALQDKGGQCVSLLIWRLWAAVEGRSVDDALLERAARAAKTLEIKVLRPSRRLRARLKATAPLADPSDWAGVYRLFLEAELAAERELIEALEALTPPPGTLPLRLLADLEAMARAFGGKASRKLLVRLVAAC